MRTSLVIPIGLLLALTTGCAEPSVTVDSQKPKVSATTTSEAPSPGFSSQPRLVLREAMRGKMVLVPDSWELDGQDGGGSGSSSTWSDPLDPDNRIYVEDGVGIGGWYETDGVNGSVDPTLVLPRGAKITRMDRTTFRFSYSPTKGMATSYQVNGVWLADLRGMSYALIEVSVSEGLEQTASKVLDAFEKDTIKYFAEWE
jgi:hypothetical protein